MQISFKEVSKEIYETYGTNSILPIVYAVASVFKPEIIKVSGCFPILILNGAFATGKTSLTSFIKQMLGQPMEYYDLNNRTNLTKTLTKNNIAFFDDFTLSDLEKNEHFIIGTYNNAIFCICKKDSKGFQEFPLNSALILSMVEMPNNEIILNRCLIQRFVKADLPKIYLLDESIFFDDKYNCDCSDEIISYRHIIEKNFDLTFSENIKDLTKLYPNLRVAYSISVVKSIFDLLKDKLEFPFDEKLFNASLSKSIIHQ
jgi:hypothetical protein